VLRSEDKVITQQYDVNGYDDEEEEKVEKSSDEITKESIEV
jgi:hypothetical protein